MGTSYKSINIKEPLLTAHLITYYPDPHTEAQSFRNRMKTEMETLTEGIENIENVLRSLNSLNYLLSKYYEHNADILSQLFGLYRIWGHPSVNELDGVIEFGKVSSRKRHMNAQSIRLITQKWREYCCINYHNVHHKWPKFKKESIMKDCYFHLTHAPLDRSHPDYHLGDRDEKVRHFQSQIVLTSHKRFLTRPLL